MKSRKIPTYYKRMRGLNRHGPLGDDEEQKNDCVREER